MVFGRNHTGNHNLITLPVMADFTLYVFCYKEGDSMKVGFIGAGKMGFTLGRHLVECADKRIHVAGYFSQNIESAKAAAKFTDTAYYDDLEELVDECDVLFLTVPDGQIEVMANKLSKLSVNLDGKIMCHTSGALSSQVFSGMCSRVYGYSIHPIYAVSSKTESYINFKECFVTIEGHDRYLHELVDIFKECGHEVKVISCDDKVKYHASAVFSSNLVIGLFDMAVKMLVECGFSQEEAENALKPLLKNNVDRMVLSNCKNALTGPVERCDTETVKKHLECLNNDEKSVYTLLSKQLVKIAKMKNNNDYSQLENILQ